MALNKKYQLCTLNDDKGFQVVRTTRPRNNK